MNPYPRTIVCPIFSERCLNATLRYAAFLATWSGARLLIVTVKDGPRSTELPGEPNATVRRLDSPDDEHFPELDDVVYELYELRGEPVSGLHDFAARVEADLVVVGNDIGWEHGATLGHTTRRLANCLDCNVVVIKQPDGSESEPHPWHQGWLCPSEN